MTITKVKPRFVVPKDLASGETAFYWEVPTYYRSLGCTIPNEPIGTDYRKISPRVRAMVWKEYFYVPVVPRVAEGRVWWPAWGVDAQLHRWARVMPTLDEYPSSWVRRASDERLSECVLRQFEAQWFLKMCIYVM